ncbi:hypothetical protein [Mycobacterium tilburgii]|uniref:hypothetical protein n=1 Tax=Mycobacterium tilburgii TaxID=44467 RepID=UPI0021B4BC27|nr:hypothetical protein [Mycobacterium tilburgii]
MTRLGYSTQRLSITAGRIAERVVMFSLGGGRPRDLLLADEHDTWTLTVGQSTAHGEPPADFATMFAAAEHAADAGDLPRAT